MTFGSTMSVLRSLVFLLLYPFAVLGLVIKFLFSLISYCKGTVVGIFSYSAPEEYSWISQGLRSSGKEVKPMWISVNNKRSFKEEAQTCNFAILYHTQNRGRLNITNVTDSLYGDEIRYLADSKGRLNVIVVIDDVQRNDNEEKLRILRHQPDIGEYAQDLLLFNGEDKMQVQKINQNIQKIRDLMTDILRPVDFCNYLSSMTHWVFSQMVCRRHQEELYGPLLV